MSSDPEFRTLRRARSIQVGPLHDWEIREIDVPIPGLAAELSGLRIVHLSDTHFRPGWHESYDALLADIASLNPDLIAFTGDWVEDKLDHRSGMPVAQQFARGLKARLGVFSCLGNHDGDLLAPYLIDADVRILVGEMTRILGGDASVEIIGLPGVGRDDVSSDLLDSFGRPAPGAFRLVLSHFPDGIVRSERLGAHLTLSGHTHGGQVCLPGRRPIITHDALPRRFSSGLHRWTDGNWLHVSRGLGTSAYPIRAFSPPEVTVLKLTPSA